MNGIDRKDILGACIGDHFPHLNSPSYRSRIDNIFWGSAPIIFSSQFHKHIFPSPLPNGGLRIQHTVVTPVPIYNRNDFFALFAIEDVSDLTRRIQDYKTMRDKALEEVEQRKKAEMERRKKEEEISSIVESAPDIISNLDRDGKILFINRSILNQSVEGMIGKNIMDYILSR